MMSAPLIIAVPSKGRLQENTNAFFGRAGLKVLQPGGARNYRGKIREMDNVEIAFLSASEIARELAAGNVHLGVTGEDLIHETIPHSDGIVEIVMPLGFGHADVVIAVPEAWIDARTMSDLDDIAHDMRGRAGRQLRVATKYINLTRSYFARHGIADYVIVESLGATEGAPASGAADIIVDITSTGSTLRANNLKILDDGVILKSEANLVASLTADWSDNAIAALREILDRTSAEERARSVRQVMASGVDMAEASRIAEETGSSIPFAGLGESVILHVPNSKVYEAASGLRAAGARAVSVSSLDDVFGAENPVFDRLRPRLG
ncbi:ATP phosphoribosyltransferase [Coralliovum pocilloporae]|uniref:ATP phosphoribosyltransferase n=1 Tax=Coralliovum pocilloporae TaxID=3066369 RepID=UPI003306E2CA